MTPALTAPITDRAAIEALFAADFEAEAAQQKAGRIPHQFLPTTPDDGDEGAAND